ncbi:MAG: hypothetical protein H7061_14750 [Bdellovibrionaceae bacterium]|nr:hypothetical protein [Bdellovibrio sp.]
MRSILKDFSHLWPASREAVLGPILSKATYLRFPEDLNLIALEKKPESVVVITSGVDLFAIRPFLFNGFRHFVNRNREDLPQELLASCLMIARPAKFVQNPIPFFLAGFSDVQIFADTERNFTVKFQDSSEKNVLLKKLETFLAKNQKTRSLSDLCIQTADELITNALYNAPIDSAGDRMYLNVDRQVKISYPPDKTATLFACCSDDRITIGCEDTFGSLSKTEMFQYLRSKFNSDLSVPTETTGGAGLGIKMIMENAANFYLFSEKNRRTLVAASFLLTGLKSNM